PSHSLTPSAAQPPAPSIRFRRPAFAAGTPHRRPPLDPPDRRRPSPPTSSRSTPPLPDTAAVASPRPLHSRTPPPPPRHAGSTPGRCRRRLASPDPGRRRDSRRRPGATPTATLPRSSRQSPIHIRGRCRPPIHIHIEDSQGSKRQPPLRALPTASAARITDLLHADYLLRGRCRPPIHSEDSRGQLNHIHTAVPGGEPQGFVTSGWEFNSNVHKLVLN
ncbi:Os12g0539333, partial [Oryza sativa Japonica Group]